MRYRVLAISFVALIALLFSSHARGELVGYYYEGNVTTVLASGGGSPFGVSVPNSTPVYGTFWYDTLASGVPGSLPGVMLYAQQPVGVPEQAPPFTMNFGAPPTKWDLDPPTPALISAEADAYRFEVYDNSNQPSGVVDMIVVRFVTGLTPAIAGLLTVNGSPRSASTLNLSLQASASAFSGTLIPSDLNFITTFPQTNGEIFADTGASPPFPPDLFFRVTELIRIPEPSSLVLLALGMACTAARQFHKRSRLRSHTA